MRVAPGMPAMTAPLVLDCAAGEGGGGLFRAALPLSIISGRPVRFENFRVGRREAGVARGLDSKVQQTVSLFLLVWSAEG